MTIKDNNGNYIWKPGLEIGKPDTLLNRPLKTSAFMPEIKGGSKVMAFGDYSYYWVADRQNRTFRRLNELYARTDQGWLPDYPACGWQADPARSRTASADGTAGLRKLGKEESVMALIPLYEAKTYLRVDSSDEDALIGILLSSAEQMCKDVGRLSEDQWEAVNAADRDAENGVQPTRELEALRSTCRVAILYALGYLYEHRDEADHKQLMLTLRSILFAVREGVF